MTDQERLQEIKDAHEQTMKKPFFTTTAHPTDVAWLIKQAERVQELELQLAESEGSYVPLKIENTTLSGHNQRYKLALEFYADEDNYDFNWMLNQEEPETGAVLKDNGKKARQALKGE